MLNVTWRRFDQSAKQLIVGHTTYENYMRLTALINFDTVSRRRLLYQFLCWSLCQSECRSVGWTWVQQCVLVISSSYNASSTTPAVLGSRASIVFISIIVDNVTRRYRQQKVIDTPLQAHFFTGLPKYGWLGSRVVGVLDSGAEGPGFKSQPRRCRESLRQTVHTRCASVHQAAKLIAALLRVAGVTAGLEESHGSLPSGLWLTSPAG